MTVLDYKRKALNLIDDYLAGKTTRESVWQWAQEVMISQESEQLPVNVQDDIHGLWLLHDNEGSWVPNTEELRRIRDDLAKL